MKLLVALNSASKRSFEYSERHLTAIACICLTALPASTFVERYVADPAFDTLAIRLSAALVGGALLLSKKFQNGFYLYWIGAVSYILPFSFALMLVLNAAYTPPGNAFSSIWIYEYLVALFLFVNIIHHGPLSAALWLISTFLAACSLLFVNSPNWSVLNDAVILPFPVFLTAVLVGSLVNRNVAMVQREKLKAASAIGANLAHELRTPLASISALSKGVANLLPILTAAYDRAKEAGIPVEPLRKSQLNTLNDTLQSIGREVEYSNTIIDMLLLNTADRPLKNVELDTFRASEAVFDATDRFPFNNQRERDLVDVAIEQDFELDAPRLLLVHVLFNLIKNALYFVQKSSKGKILISVRRSGSGGTIVVHDTGMGIPASVQPHIFERFYTTTPTSQSAGIGLSFCKLVLDSIGGRIDCESREGEHTTFTLTFPDVRDETPALNSAPAPETA